MHAESLEDLKILNFLFSKEGKDPRNGETEWKEKYIMNVSVPEENSSEIFIKRSDSTLKAALLLILFLLATEPFIMVVKSNFLSLLAGISLITIFILDCLNVAYVRFCLLLLLTNMLFDVLWFFCKGIVRDGLFRTIGMGRDWSTDSLGSTEGLLCYLCS